MKFTNYFASAIIVIAFCGCSNKGNVQTPPATSMAPDTTAAKVVFWQTSADEQTLLKRQQALAYSKGPIGNVNINIDTTETYQQMDGFGYTLTGGSAMLINRMPADQKAILLKELFGNGESGISVSYLRLSIGASDLDPEVYTYDDIPSGQTDVNLDHFSIDKEKTDLIPLLKEIISISPSIRIIATPWTSPVWMKNNQNSIGGILKPKYYPAYAEYFVKYIQAMQAEGIQITAITPQNEPLNDGNNPSLVMQDTEQAEFIKNHLGPAFQKAGINTKIILYDHNCDRPDYPLNILNDSAAKVFVDGSAFHLYNGDISALTQVHAAHPDKNVYFTEQYTASNSNFGGDLRWHIKNLVIGAPRNWSKTVFEWNLANDVNYGPHTPGGCTTCKGALTIDGAAVKRNVGYYIIAHISKFVPAGSTRVASDIAGDLHSVAFVTPSNKKVLIVLNDDSASSIFNIRFNGNIVNAQLPSGSVATYILD